VALARRAWRDRPSRDLADLLSGDRP
jgi:hypothetical protein